MTVTNDIKYIGVNDHQVDLFEGQYDVPLGMAYNSYAILDEKIAVMDTVDANFGEEWINNLEAVLDGRKPDYLIVQHMEPDHSANITRFMDAYPEAVVVSSDKAFVMMKNFFGTDYADRRMSVKEGSKLELGKHVLNFVGAPMVHWPEVLSPMIVPTRSFSPRTVLESSVPMMWKIRKAGPVKPDATISVSLASTARKYRRF